MDKISEHFDKKEIWVAYKYMERCSVAFVIREMPIKTTKHTTSYSLGLL